MPLSRYMTLALSHATLGYYTRGDVFGRKGDFITSPEISQVFGEVSYLVFLSRFLDPSPDASRSSSILRTAPGHLLPDSLASERLSF